MLKQISFSILCLLNFSLAIAQTDSTEKVVLTKEEKQFVRKANTAKYAFYMRKQSRESILLMNLARTNGPLFVKYIQLKYGDEYANKPIVRAFYKINVKQKMTFLKPDYRLHLDACFHAFISGITNYEGHRWFNTRLILSGSFRFLLPNIFLRNKKQTVLYFGTSAGENCIYGYHKSIDYVIGWLGSPGHRANILNNSFMRVGVSHKWHFGYKCNTVADYYGPRFRDELLHRKIIKKFINR